ncbi:kinase-like domain-containing protein [Paraphysoderma sedebokerense]|nr:kinase-like domain-containing protein [Paraphysoderma sedebokerense]
MNFLLLKAATTVSAKPAKLRRKSGNMSASNSINSAQLKAMISDPMGFRHIAHAQNHGEAGDVLSEIWKTGEKLPNLQNSSVSSFDTSGTAANNPTNSLTPSSSKRNVISRTNTADSNLSTTPSNSNPITSQSRSRPISVATAERTVAAKIYFENYFDKLFKNPNPYGRSRRRIQLEAELDALGVSDAEKRKIRSEWLNRESQHIRKLRERISVDSFEILKTLGHGAFGTVKLAREKETGNLYALKIMDKTNMLLKGQEGHVRAERDLLSEASEMAEWIVSLVYSFQDNDNLYLAMEYMPGGDLLSLLIKFDIFEEDFAKFYAAQMVCCIEEAHKMGYVHRDIKPDNFLFTESGHLKISDFGLSTDFHWVHDSSYFEAHRRKMLELVLEPEIKNGTAVLPNAEVDLDVLVPPTKQNILDWRNKSRRQMAYSVVGTNNYIAPEVLEGLGHDKKCDWWSLGVIIFEMLFGYPPFCSSTPNHTRQKILQHKKYLRIPSSPQVSREAQDLIERLMTSRSNRLSCNENGDAVDIKNHPWFRGIDWDSIRYAQPPWCPQLENEVDTRYFDHMVEAQIEMGMGGLNINGNGNANDNPEKSKPSLPPSPASLQQQKQTNKDDVSPSSSDENISADQSHKNTIDEILEMRKKLAFKGFTFKVFKGGPKDLVNNGVNSKESAGQRSNSKDGRPRSSK